MLTERPTEIPFAPAADARRATLSAHLDRKALEALVERLPLGIVLTDRDGRVAYANAAARGMPADVPALRWAVTRALLTEEAVRERAVAVRHPDGEDAWLDVEVTPLREEGAVVAALATLVDVTAATRLTQWSATMESLARL